MTESMEKPGASVGTRKQGDSPLSVPPQFLVGHGEDGREFRVGRVGNPPAFVPLSTKKSPSRTALVVIDQASEKRLRLRHGKARRCLAIEDAIENLLSKTRGHLTEQEAGPASPVRERLVGKYPSWPVQVIDELPQGDVGDGAEAATADVSRTENGVVAAAADFIRTVRMSSWSASEYPPFGP